MEEKKENKKKYNISMSVETVKKIDDYARFHDLSRSGVISLAVNQFLLEELKNKGYLEADLL